MPGNNLKQRYIQKAKEIFAKNLLKGHSKWKNTDYKFIAPANVEYTYQFFWDTAFHCIVLSHFNTEWAKSEIRNFLKAQWDDGFLPHIIFWGGNTGNLPHWAFIESKFSIRPRTSALTQPAVFPLAVESIYKKDPDKTFLKEVLPKFAKHYRWLLGNRDNDGDNLLSIISPNESGMDELPVFQIAAGYKGGNTARLHYTYRKGDLLNKSLNYDNKKIFQMDYFNVEEVLFNCTYAESCRALSRLFSEIGNENEREFFEDTAKKTERAVLEKCWDQEDEIFYSLYSKKEKKARVKTIASLMPIFLEGIPEEKLNKLITKHLLNPKEFWRPYPIPSVAASEHFYVPTDTPFYKVKLLWRGPTWINTNWFIIKGLIKHGHKKIADQIVGKMCEMIEKYGFREYYNPETGEGYRRENFGWSTLIVDLI